MHDNPRVDAALDEYCDAVASLHLDGAHVGYLATKVESLRGGLLLRRQARVWLPLTRLDGSRYPIQEDDEPWTYVSELSEGRIEGVARRAEVAAICIRGTREVGCRSRTSR